MPKSFKFAVGDADELRSSMWCVWVEHGKSPDSLTSDIYITPRPLGGIMKVSLHASGQYQLSFTSEFVNKMKLSRRWSEKTLPNRHIAVWRRPPEISPGVTLTIRICIPFAELRKMPEKPNTKLIWVKRPEENEIVEFDFIITRTGTQVSGWPGKNKMNTYLLNSFILKNDDKFWIVYRYEPINPKMSHDMNSKRIAVQNYTDNVTGKSDPNWRVMMHGFEPDGSITLYELAVSNNQLDY